MGVALLLSGCGALAGLGDFVGSDSPDSAGASGGEGGAAGGATFGGGGEGASLLGGEGGDDVGGAAGGGTGGSGAAPSYWESVLNEGPILYYRFDEPSFTSMIDETGNFNGSYVGTITKPIGLFPFSSSLHVETSTGGYGYAEGSWNAQTLTVEAWIKLDGGLFSHKGLIWIGSDDGNHLSLYYLDSPRELVYANEPSPQAPRIVIPTPYDSWHHIVVTRQADILGFYFDGEWLGNQQANGDGPEDEVEIFIGTDPGFQQFSTELDGAIDEVAIYPHVLSTEVVVDHYERGIAAR